jgi:site-specific recombinase XerD
VLDSKRLAAGRSLTEHIADFEAELLAKGNTSAYVDLKKLRVQRICSKCKFGLWSDINAGDVQRCLTALRNGKENISAQTYNFYLQAFKQFCKWMVRDSRAAESPVEYLTGMNA